MATKLGPVEIPLKLNVTDAQQQLNQLEKELKGKGLRRPGFQPIQTNPAAASSRAGTGSSGGSTISQVAQQNFMQQVTGGVIKRVGGGLSGNPLASMAQGGISQAGGFFPGMPPALKALGTAAAAYGIASQTIKKLPEAFALGKVLAGDDANTRSMNPATNAIDETLMLLKRRVTELEVHVTGLLKGMDKAVDQATASMRVTGGKMPEHIARLVQATVQLEKQDQMLNARFETWKTREAPFATIRTWVDALKDGMRR